MPPAELCVVGDSDQSIYAFRGASIRNILEFEHDYPDARTILLEQNYRSTQRILRAANSVIARNEGRRAKNLWTDSGDGAMITGYVGDNEHDEAAFVAKEIDDLATHGVKPGDVAVFYRTNAQSRAVEEVLVRVGLPYKVVGGTRFYERREVKDALAYLRVVSNPTDTVNLRRILNTPKRGIGDRAEACVAALAERERIPFVAALGRAEDAPGIATRSVAAIKGFTALLERLRTAYEADDSVAALLEMVLEESGYLAELRASHDPQDETRIENLAELVAVAQEYDERRATELQESGGELPPGVEPEDVGPAGALEEFLEQVSLVADADEIPDAPEGSAAQTSASSRLMTLHTAKGLEFPVVFLTGLEDGTFPHMRALGRPQGARGGAPPRLRRHHPGPRAALPQPRRRPVRVGRAAVQPAVALPRRDPGRPARLAAARAVVQRRPRRPTARPSRRSRPGPGCAAPASGRSSRCTPVTGSATTPSASAPSCASRARATSRWPTSTSARRPARSASCCATPRSSSSEAHRSYRRAHGATRTADGHGGTKARAVRRTGARGTAHAHRHTAGMGMQTARPGGVRAGVGACGAGQPAVNSALGSALNLGLAQSRLDAALGEPGARGDCAAVAGVDLEVDVRAGRVAGAAAVGDGLAGSDLVAERDEQAAVVGHPRDGAVPVLDLDHVAVALGGPAGEDHGAGRQGVDGGADRAGEVLGRVHLAPAEAEAGGEGVAGDGDHPAVGERRVRALLGVGLGLGMRPGLRLGRAAAACSALAFGLGSRRRAPAVVALTMRVLASRARSREERAPERLAAAAATADGSAARPRPATVLETFFIAAASGLSSLAPASRMTSPPATVVPSRATGTTNCRPREGFRAGR